MSDSAPRVDVGILTFRQDELAAVQERFPTEGIYEGKRRYSLSHVSLGEGESYRVACTQIVQTTGSGDDAADAVRNLVEDVGPTVILLVGVAATMPSDEVTLGDVVVATRVVDANYLDLDRDPALRSEPLHKDVARWASNLSLVEHWQEDMLMGWVPSLPGNLQMNRDLNDNVRSSLKQHFSGSFSYRAGGTIPSPHNKLRPPCAAVGTAVAIDGILDDTYFNLLERNRTLGANAVIALEASSWPAYAAARAQQVPLMSIRGIGEMPGLERDRDWIQYACRVAASFALAFLKTRPVPPRQPNGHDKSASEPLPDRPIDLTSTFAISRIVLSDVRGFRTLDLSLKQPAPDQEGQWTILLGNNGVGKTTLLRALALALAPADVAPLVLSRAGMVSPTVRTGSSTAVIQAGFPAEEEVTILEIEPTKGGERLKRRRVAHVAMPFLVAYGSRRGSGLAGSARGADPSSAAAVETLFDEGANLIQPDVWLMGWQLAALQSPDSQDERFFRAILATLRAVLPDVKEIHVSREGIEVEGPTIGRVPLGALSDGYRTTMGWILDMIARWVEEAKRRDVPIDGDFHEKMTGVVLIDEIDLHLHPRWQRDVITMVRGHFPRMSFVVTTHNPLTLLGSRPGEIHVLTRLDQGDVSVEQRDLPAGIDAEQVLTGEWFGLASTLDDATLAKLAEHQRLILEEGLDAPAAVAVEQEFRRRLGSYASTSVERLAQEAAAQVIDKDIRRLTPDERRGVQAKIAELLREDLPGSHKPVIAKRVAAKDPKRAAAGKTRAAPQKPTPGKQKPKARRTERSAR